MGAHLLVLYKIAPHRLTLFWALAFFGTFANFVHGQNGFLSAALLGGGLLLLENSPLMGGILLGLLSYKPHLARAHSFGAAGKQAVAGPGRGHGFQMCMILASSAVFGLDIWGIFLKNIHTTINNLYTQPQWFYKMPSIFAAARLAGLDTATAWNLAWRGNAGRGGLVGVALGPAGESPVIRAGALVLATYFLAYPGPRPAPSWPASGLALGRKGAPKAGTPRNNCSLLASWASPHCELFHVGGPKWPNGPLYLVGPFILVVQRYYWVKKASAAKSPDGSPVVKEPEN